MNSLCTILKYAVASCFISAPSLMIAPPLLAQETRPSADGIDLDALFADLAKAEPREALALENQIRTAFSRSGSDAMDLLLERGHEALDEGQPQLAIEHFTALIDHAPDFTEGYNARAIAYYAVGLFGPAMADLAETLAQEPRHFGALSGLAAILEQVERYGEARAVVAQIEAIHPNMLGLDVVIERLDLALSGATL